MHNIMGKCSIYTLYKILFWLWTYYATIYKLYYLCFVNIYDNLFITGVSIKAHCSVL